MKPRKRNKTIHRAWWTVILIAVVAAFIFLCFALFAGTFNSYVPVLLTSDRSGLVMESGAAVKLRGVEVGRVENISGGAQSATLRLKLNPDQIKYIPANVQAQIQATTLFGAKYVDLIDPPDPSPKRIFAGAVVHARNVSTEVNTVFQNLVDLLHQIDPAKLNATLTALADGLRGQGDRIGQATSDANQVLLAINPRMGTVRHDVRSLKGLSDAYNTAAHDILATLNAATTISTTITTNAAALDTLLLNTIGLAHSGINLLGPNRSNLIRSINILEPTTNLLMKYNPEYTCMLLGAQRYLDHGAYPSFAGNGSSVILDDALILGSDSYRYPDNLPLIGAKGGPGGKPGCGSLPDVSKNYPVRQLVTNTGWGTGLDIRPNPGIGHPCYADYLPVTRAVPEPPSIRQCIPGPAPGPIPYPGAPPYGAPLYAADGTPLYPGVPPPPSP